MITKDGHINCGAGQALVSGCPLPSSLSGVSRCLGSRIINLETMWKFPDDIMLNKPVICIQIIFTKLFLSITTIAQPTFDYGII